MKRFKLKKVNNDGAALIFVVVIVMFITILTTLLLYVAAMNYEMKTTDYRTRVSFYGAEIPLEELRMQMAVDTAQAAEKAYKSVMLKYGIISDPLTAQPIREAEYQKVFFEEIETIWAGRAGVGATADWCMGVHTAMGGNTAYEVITGNGFNNAKQWHIQLKDVDIDPVSGLAKPRLYREEDKGRIILHNIAVTYTKDGFTSVIETDFCINVPEIDWSINKSSDPSTGITAADALEEKINFEEFVTYLDWEKQ